MLSSPSVRPERIRVSQACEQCRNKKSKCDGKKPICGRCNVNALDCQYGFTRGAKNQQIIKNLATKVAQYESLLRKNIPIQQSLQRQESLSFVDVSSNAISPSVSSASESSSVQFSSALSASIDSRRPSVTISKPSRGDTNFVIASDLWGTEVGSNIALPPRDLIEQSSLAFSNGSGFLFNLFDDQEIEQLVQELYTNQQKSINKIALCQLCAISAVGCQYEPARFDAGTRTALLGVAKAHLEECIEGFPLCAMRVTAILSLYFTFEKRNSALVYAAMGLRMAKMYHHELSIHREPSALWRNTLFSLIFLECWLCATTGHLATPAIQELHTSAMALGTGDGSVATIVQLEMVKVAVLSCSVLQDVYHTRFVSTTIMSSYRNILQQQLLELPEFMRLDALLDADEGKPHLRSIFLVHLYYMTTLALIYRRALADLARLSKNRVNSDIYVQTRSFLDPCLWACRQIAKILKLTYSQGQILPKCWMFVNSTHCTCHVLLYFVASQLLNTDSLEGIAHDLAAAENCIEILQFCAEYGETAAQYLADTFRLYSDLAGVVGTITSPLSANMRIESDKARITQQLQQIVALSAAFLLHPFDGGVRHDLNHADNVAEDANAELSLLHDNSPSRESPAPTWQLPSHSQGSPHAAARPSLSTVGRTATTSVKESLPHLPAGSRRDSFVHIFLNDLLSDSSQSGGGFASLDDRTLSVARADGKTTNESDDRDMDAKDTEIGTMTGSSKNKMLRVNTYAERKDNNMKRTRGMFFGT